MSMIIREAGPGPCWPGESRGPRSIGYEGNLYFVAVGREPAVLRVTERTYTCPYKGTCNWVDFVGPDRRVVRDVAWVYPESSRGTR